MKVILKHPVTVVNNLLLPNQAAEITTDDTNWKLHSSAKRFFNLYEFLEKVGRLDILEMHFDPNHQDMVIYDPAYQVINGKPCSSQYYYGTKRSKLDEELDFLMADDKNKDLWNSLREKRMNWKKQKIYSFEQTREIDYIPM